MIRTWSVPVRRLGMTTQVKRILALYPDQLLVVTVPEKTVIPESAYFVQGDREALLALKQIEPMKEYPLEEIRRLVFESGLTFRVETVTGAAEAFSLTSEEDAPHLARALHLLSGEQFAVRGIAAEALFQPRFARALHFLLGKRYFVVRGITAEALFQPLFARDAAAWKAKRLIAARHEAESLLHALLPRRKKRTPYRSKVVGSILVSLAILLLFGPFVMTLHGIYSDIQQRASQEAHLQEAHLRFSQETQEFMKAFDEVASWATLGFLALTFGGGCMLLRIGRKMRLPTVEEALKKDGRRPILYLRAFDEEEFADPKEAEARNKNQVLQQLLYRAPLLAALAYVPWFIRFLRGRDWTRFEEHLSWFFKTYGPLVAIGRPGEELGIPKSAPVLSERRRMARFHSQNA